MTDAEIENELNKCVSCCEDMGDKAEEFLNVCNPCYATVKCQLPIPPQCLDMEVPPFSSVAYLSKKPRGIYPSAISEIGKQWKVHMKVAGYLQKKGDGDEGHKD